MPSYSTYCICGRCAGTGIGDASGNPPVPEDPCTACDGVGFYPNIRGNLPPKVVNTWEISNALDVAEYAALAEGNQVAVNIILSQGTARLAEGDNNRTTLWALFDAESTTRANLIELLGE